MPSSEASKTETIKISIFNDYPVIVAGITAMFADDPRVEIVEELSLTLPNSKVDLTLFDDFADDDPVDSLRKLAANPHAGKIVLFTWRPDSSFAAQAAELGAAGVLAKTLDADELADQMLAIASEVSFPEKTRSKGSAAMKANWPGKADGISPRESEMLSLIARGHTNEQIAEICDLSINSVKSYIRSAYRKIGVKRRSQAVVWAMEHGLLPVAKRGGVGPQSD